jgi:hypothetical protein
MPVSDQELRAALARFRGPCDDLRGELAAIRDLLTADEGRLYRKSGPVIRVNRVTTSDRLAYVAGRLESAARELERLRAEISEVQGQLRPADRRAVTFSARLQPDGQAATEIEVPKEVVASLDAGRRPAVTATINGVRFDTTLNVRHGASMIPVNAERRQAARIREAQAVDVALELR